MKSKTSVFDDAILNNKIVLDKKQHLIHDWQPAEKLNLAKQDSKYLAIYSDKGDNTFDNSHLD